MGSLDKQLSSPFSTGGGGHRFEIQVQASFVALMLAGGYAPCLPAYPINKIKLQGKFAGYETDDLIVFTQEPTSNTECKLLGQIKHSIALTENDSTFEEVIQAAWKDFNNPKVFSRKKDVIALITGPLSATDTADARTILEWARCFENSGEFFKNVNLAKFSSKQKQSKLQAFRANLKKANKNVDVPDDEVFNFLKHFHLLGYDLDIKAGVTLALLHSLISQFRQIEAPSIWARLLDEVSSVNQNAGTIITDNLPEDLVAIFNKPQFASIPETLVKPKTPKPNQTWGSQDEVKALTTAMLLGKWQESKESDLEIIKRLIDGL